MKSGISFVLLFVVLWLVKKTHAIFSANQSDANPKPITTWLHAFSRASSRLAILNLSSHWLLVFLCLSKNHDTQLSVTTLNYLYEEKN